jgi:hypothetical protein
LRLYTPDQIFDSVCILDDTARFCYHHFIPFSQERL